MSSSLISLGIESSCDDTSVAVVTQRADRDVDILSLITFRQNDLHHEYGGVVPEIAARAHATRLDLCTKRALKKASLELRQVDLIAVTSGPGLIGGLMAGVAFAKGLAAGSGKPFLGINHLAGHALTARMTHGVDFPYLALLASGGHCQFLLVQSPTTFTRLGATIDDAPGEAFDKSARLLGLPQPGGPAIEAMAQSGDPHRFELPRPLSGRMGCYMSFSGLKTALLRTRQQLVKKRELPDPDRNDLAASFQQAIVDIFVEKSGIALEEYHQRLGERASTFVVCGGVAANRAIRENLQELSAKYGVEFVAPPAKYCTDNAAMIAWAGLELFGPGRCDPFDLKARPRWPLDETASPIHVSGKKGQKS